MKKLIQQDLVEALEHMSDFEDAPLDLAAFEVSEVRLVPFSELQNYDDLGSWPEWRSGELRELSEEDLVDELEHFRGKEWADRAMAWRRPEQIPPVVVVEAPTSTAIADGRGRVSYAIGMGWSGVPAVIARYVP